jgi:hypothetical protein
MTLKVLSNKVYNPNSSNDPAINAILISSLSSLFNPPNNNVFNPFYHSCFVNMFILRLSLTYLLESFTFLHIPFTYSSKIHQTGESNPWLDATATTFNYLISTSQFTLNPSTKISLSSLFSPQFLYSLKANKAVQDDSDSQNTPSLIRNSEKLLYFYRQGGVKVLLDALMITSKTEWWFEDKGFDDDDHKAEISSDNLSDDDDINALSPILPVSLLIDPVSSTLLSLILSLFSPSIITSEITRPSLPTSTKTSGPNGDLNKTGSTSSNVEVMTEADVLSLDMVDYKSYAEEVVDDHGVTTVVRALTREVCLLGKYGDGGELDEKQIKAYQDGILSGFKTEVYELLNNERSVIKKMEKIDENDGDIKVNGEEPEMEEEVEEEGEEIEKEVEVGLLDEEKKEKKKKVIKVVKKKPKEISDADLSINLVPKSKKLIKKINEYMSSFNIPLFSLQTLSRPSDTRKDNTQILLKRSVYASDRSDEKNDTSQAVAQAEEKIQLNAPLTVTSSTASFIQSSFAFLLSLISSNTVITATAFSGDLMHIFERWKGIGLGFTEGSTAITDTETSVMLFVVLAHCLNILNTEDGYYIYAPDKTLKKNQQQNAGDGAIRRMASVSRTPSFVSGAPVVGDTTSKPTQVGTQTSRLMVCV